MDGARQTEQTGAPDMDALRLENAQLRDRAEKAEAMYRQRDAEASAWQQTANDLYTGNPPSEPDMAAGLKLMQEHMRQRDQMKQERDAAIRCAEKAERELAGKVEELRLISQLADIQTEQAEKALRDGDQARARLADLERWREQAVPAVEKVRELQAARRRDEAAKWPSDIVKTMLEFRQRSNELLALKLPDPLK